MTTKKSMKVSIVIPVYDMKNKDFFLGRCLESIKSQTHKNYEILTMENGKGMAGNTNDGIKKATGDIIKFLFMDDFFTNEDSLKNIVDAWKPDTVWMATGCKHTDGSPDHYPMYNDNIHMGLNTIGSPSVVAIRNKKPMLFDKNMTWLLDCDYYKRMKEKYGPPEILKDLNVTIGIGEHQATNILSNELKANEHIYMQKKYDK